MGFVSSLLITIFTAALGLLFLTRFPEIWEANSLRNDEECYRKNRVPVLPSDRPPKRIVMLLTLERLRMGSLYTR